MAEEMANGMQAEYWKTSAKISILVLIFDSLPQDENVQQLFERIAVTLFEKAILRSITNEKEEQRTEIGSGRKQFECLSV
jgi:hypothetical protein